MPEIFDFNGKPHVQDRVDGKITFTDGTGKTAPNMGDSTPAALISPVADGYYTTKKRKIIDMLIGFFVLFTLSYILGPLMNNVPFFAKNIFLVFCFVAVLPIALVVWSLKVGRKYIAIGALITYFVPVLYIFIALGSCFLPFSR